MIVLYTGRRGCGKTLSMVKDAYTFLQNGWTIYSNIELAFKHEYISEKDILDIDSDSTINNAVLVIDEIQTLLDSRRSGSGTNVKFSHFIQQIRKRNIIILSTTQFSGTVDLRLRQHVDILAKPRFNKNFKVCEVTYIDLTVVDEADLYDDHAPSVTIIFDCRPIFEMYDTFRMIQIKKREKRTR